MRLILIPIAGAALVLAGCSATPPAPKPHITLTEVPADIVACARKIVGAPKGTGPIPKRELYLKIDELKGSEADKSACLWRLIALHEADTARLALILDGAL
ncbi:hypothetical protein [Xanthobacter flavus]|uniref:hypothetical protein n=1 Tax=Xanthobacter flavus TaxID=281 RepID=UPI001AE17571|nr:hypothetical protein [Xanthobacter flavus]MBP2147913.1 hypothetical protein [Xanthobacter flavus]